MTQYTNPGRLYIDGHGPVAGIDDVIEYCAFLRAESGLSVQPPIDIQRIYARFDIPQPRRALLPNQQGLLLSSEKGVILINYDDPPLRQRFTEAHEVMELLFSCLPRGRDRMARQKAGPFQEAAKERLCNEGAAELLMPRASFLPRVAAFGVSFDTARKLALEYAVSVSAALVHMARVATGRHAVVVWRMKNKPSEVTRSAPKEQLRMFGDPLGGGIPATKLRVGWCLAGEGAFIPQHKSVPEGCSIYRAWSGGTFTVDRDWLDLGPIKGMLTCENQPFMLGDERYVLSLLHLPGDAGCGPAALAQSNA